MQNMQMQIDPGWQPSPPQPHRTHPQDMNMNMNMNPMISAQGPWQEAREGEFEMMDVSLRILGLTGITSQAVKTKKNRNSMSAPNGGDGIGDGDVIPVTATVSFSKNVTSSKTSIWTHLPSLALDKPASSFGNTSRYAASWPSPFNDDDSFGGYGGMAQNGKAAFKFSRVMKRHVVNGSWDGENTVTDDAGGGAGVFTPETMDILVGVGHGSDMIPLGVATLVITGEEVGEVQVNLPVKTGNDALAAFSVSKKKKKKSNKKMFEKLAKGAKNSKKGAYFNASPGTRYSLEETATLRLAVKAVLKNGGYDHDGSIVSGLSCPTGSSDGGSSSDSSSASESEDEDVENNFNENSNGVKSRSSQHSKQQQRPQQPCHPHFQHPPQEFRDISMSHQHHNQNTPEISSPRHHVKTHMMLQEQKRRMNEKKQQHQQMQPHRQMQQMHQAQQSHVYDGPHPQDDMAPHPHFVVPPVTSQASTEPGYGDEFEGDRDMCNGHDSIDNNQNNAMPVVQAKRKAKWREDTPMSPATTAGASSGSQSNSLLGSRSCGGKADEENSASCAFANFFSCGGISSCFADDEEEAREEDEEDNRPPIQNVYTPETGDHRRGVSRKNSGRRSRSRHDEYRRDGEGVSHSASETTPSASMISEGYY